MEVSKNRALNKFEYNAERDEQKQNYNIITKQYIDQVIDDHAVICSNMTTIFFSLVLDFLRWLVSFLLLQIIINKYNKNNTNIHELLEV